MLMKYRTSQCDTALHAAAQTHGGQALRMLRLGLWHDTYCKKALDVDSVQVGLDFGDAAASSKGLHK